MHTVTDFARAVRTARPFRPIGAAALIAAGTIGVLALALEAGPAHAGTSTSTMSVSANIAGTCSVGATSLAFGTYTATAVSTATAPIRVTCSSGVAAQVSLSQGNYNNRAASYGTRALANGSANFLGYDVYTDNTFSTVWNTTTTVPITSTGNPVTVNAYGRIPAGQSPATGSYNDSVTITVTF
jgi:spore coat protein U-like protein